MEAHAATGWVHGTVSADSVKRAGRTARYRRRSSLRNETVGSRRASLAGAFVCVILALPAFTRSESENSLMLDKVLLEIAKVSLLGDFDRQVLYGSRPHEDLHILEHVDTVSGDSSVTVQL